MKYIDIFLATDSNFINAIRVRSVFFSSEMYSYSSTCKAIFYPRQNTLQPPVGGFLFFGSKKLMTAHDGEVGKNVASDGISQVISQILEGALVGGNGLSTVTKHGEHSQAAILNFLELELVHCSLSFAQVEHIEELATGVGGVAAAVEGGFDAQEVLLALRARVLKVLPALELSKLHHNDLDKEEGIGVYPVFVVGASGRDDARAEPHSIVTGLGNDTHGRQNLRGKASSCTQHSPAAVDDLGVGQPRGVDKATGTFGVRQTQGVKSKV